MTSAKPNSVAGQSEAPEDLIAELTRLMADDARADQTHRDAPGPIRIPGAAPAPTPAAPASASRQEPQASPAVRIPGDEPKRAEAAADPDPFNFDFGLDLRKPSGPATSLKADLPPLKLDLAEPQAAIPAARSEPLTEPAAPEPELDHDSLADLIAAELASDIAPQEKPETTEIPVVAGPARGEDNFGVPPVFGLDAPVPPVSAPQPAAPRPVAPVIQAPKAEQPSAPEADLDPLDEIERLVGSAVRLNSDTPSPSPALRSLATPTLPQPPVASSRAKDAPDEVSSVDDAILAAAAATGTRVEWVDDSPVSEPDLSEDFAPVARKRSFALSKAVVGPLVAVALLLVAGFGLYWALGQGSTPSGPAPLLVADSAPTKEVPTVDTSASAQQSVVFNEISGANTGADEQIVSRDQTDESVVNETGSFAGNSNVLASADGNAVDPNQDGLVNRKVRTVTVRPDGTIISGEDSLAGGAILPVDRPNVPDVPGADFSTPELVANANAGTPTPAAATPAETPVPATGLVQPGSVVPVVNASGAAIAGRNVTIPMQRPADFAQAASAAIAAAAIAPTPAPAAAQPAATTAPVANAAQPAVTSGTGAGAYVQLSSQRSEEAARQSAQAIATRYGVLFGGANLEIQRVDLAERGIYYRVLVPAANRESAVNICTNVKAAGGDCLIP